MVAPQNPHAPIPGRGSHTNPTNRYEQLHLAADPDNQDSPEERVHPKTQFYVDATESMLTKNHSPDIDYSYGLNSYRGCEHGCSYCFARPYHEYLGFSSGLDFETKIMVKLRGPELLRREFSAPRWQPQPVAMSGATDCFQPAERHFRLTRGCLEVCAEMRHPIIIITKNFLVTRDLDLLAELARWNCVAVHVSVTTLDADLAGKLEPRAARPEHRLKAIRMLADAGVPVGAMISPVIPGLTDHEMPAILDAVAAAGGKTAGHGLLRLPHAVKEVFLQWLDDHAPGKKARVVDRLQSMRGGKLYDSDFGTRMRGEGIFAEQMHDLFNVSARRAGLNHRRDVLSTEHFRRPGGKQLELF